MATTTRTAATRARVLKICALPESSAREQQHIKFEVRGKTYAYFLDDHHGDGRVGINFKAAPGQQQALISAYPERYYMPSYLGPKGWLGLYLDAGKIDWGEVTALLHDSYRMIAPKRLAALVRQ